MRTSVAEVRATGSSITEWLKVESMLGSKCSVSSSGSLCSKSSMTMGRGGLAGSTCWRSRSRLEDEMTGRSCRGAREEWMRRANVW